MHFAKKSFVSGILYLLIAFLLGFILQICNLDAATGLRYLGYICFFELILFIILHKYSSGLMFEFSVIFASILFVFHFGQLMIYTFFINIYSHVRILRLMNESDVYYGFTIMNYAFIAICGAMLIGEAKVTNRRYKNYNMDVNDIKKIATYMVFATFPVRIVLDVITLYISLTVSGSAARVWVNTFPNVVLYYGKISFLAFALLIVLNRDNFKKQRRLFLFLATYILVMMLSGIRSENVGYLLILAFLFLFTCEKKPNLISTLGIGVAGIVVLAFISAAGEFRTISDKSFSAFIDCLSVALIEKNIVFTMLDTFGDTGYTAQSVINGWLPTYNLFLGKSYVLGLFSIIPNIPPISTFAGDITEKSSFPLYLQEVGVLSENYQNIGGSLLGELFFNFGIVGGIIVALLLGMVFGVVSKKCTRAVQVSNYRILIWLIPFMFFSIYWIRDYFGGGFREVIWGPFLFVLFKSIYNKRKKRI